MTKHHIEEIADYITSLDDDPEVTVLLSYSVGRVLMNTHRAERNWRAAARQVDMDHIVDWLRAAVATRSEWLGNVDERGRPKKLLKFSDLGAMIAEADKHMRIQSQRSAAVLEEGQEDFVAALANGFSVVRLLTPESLDRESSYMQHCIGNGGYDARIASGKYEYLSLRDATGKPHATIEVAKEAKRVLQVAGKQNDRPLPKYLRLLGPLCQQWNEAGISFDGVMGSEWIVDHEGTLHHISALPSKLVVQGSLDIEWRDCLKLPDDLTVLGGLTVRWHPLLELPTKLEVRGSLTFKDDWGQFLDQEGDAPDEWYEEVLAKQRELATFPSSLVVGGDLSVANCRINADIEHLTVGGTFHLEGVRGTVAISRLKAWQFELVEMDWTSFPDEMEVNGLTVSGCPNLTSLGNLDGVERLSIADMSTEVVPQNGTFKELHLSGMPALCSMQGITITHALTLHGTGITELPAGLTLDGPLEIHGTPIKTFPPGVSVGRLEMSKTELSRFPADMEVATDITLWEGSIRSLDGLLHVKGDLQMTYAPVRELPSGLKVDGNLRADKSSLEKIGRGISVGGRLDLRETRIAEVPDDIKVGAGMDMRESRLRWLPDNLNVGGTLNVSSTPILEIPIGLRVTDLYIQDTDIVELPAGLEVNCLYAEGSCLYEISDDVTVRHAFLSHRDDEIYRRTLRRETVRSWPELLRTTAEESSFPGADGRTPVLKFG
ncbi:PcfJ domain-containing protein [Rhizobium sp. BK176]|uniref:PcfJ domain-containing protein n=1 Tax=Rhizobium sp. BK176 TaxID=2587071 RepID=UPI002169A1F7|nr:PcfJ domain-containing protein [Rhizobium sp. BK176]MCS4089969.1 hypothetical protein [Rhizobium sp. BK176]